MFKVLPVALLTLLLVVSPLLAEPLIFAPLPMETPYTVVSQWKPLLDYLEESLGIELEIDYSLSNDEVVDKFKAGKLDLAYLGPLPYLTLREGFPSAEPVVVFHEKSGEPTYTCAIVATDAARESLLELKNRRIALTQPLSTCGYFAVQGLMQNRWQTSLQANRFRYLGPHDEVALAVVRGEFDFGGLKTAIARKYSHLGLTILAESPPFPGLALVANSQRLAPARIEAIRRALLAADADIRRQWGDNIRHGVSAASDQNYAGMRQLPLPASIPQQGNF
ncbi:MAG: PhnD/SsuA/transferrin family substrate-binding protein [Desulfuromonadales bacterium]|nr:PhnD/SsuA/transferrin family substrate-binding protein [Desulfuromonadales bacterium]